MTIAITAATGQLGRLVIQELLNRGVRPSQLVAVVRNPGKADALAAKGVTIRQASYDDPPALRDALRGVERALIISGTDIGRRVEQHANAIDAAILAGAKQIAYTSLLRAKEVTLNPLAPEHVQTEDYLTETEAPWVILRHGFYTDNYVEQARQAAQTRELTTSAGQGRMASATRADFAAGIAGVLTSDGHEGKRYEFSGDDSWTMDQLGEAISEISGTDVAVRHLEHGAHMESLLGAGVERPGADIAVGIDRAIRAGELGAVTHELSRLAGRPTTPLRDALTAAFASTGPAQRASA